jgi:hypothetical protein
MIDELVGHESALPSLLGTNRAGLGELRVDLATAAREGKPSPAISSPLIVKPRRGPYGASRQAGVRGCALAAARGNNSSETMIRTAVGVQRNSHEILTNYGRVSRLNPGAFSADQWAGPVRRPIPRTDR